MDCRLDLSLYLHTKHDLDRDRLIELISACLEKEREFKGALILECKMETIEVRHLT